MKRHAQSGIALVITLLMLSVVTLMAVVFLAISRREKASVTVVADQADARLMTDAAVARAQSEMVARLLATTNAFNYDLFVSTNFQNPAGFDTDKARVDTLNVSYTYPDGRPLRDDDVIQNIANMQYDPRPPVFIPLDEAGRTNEFRFYLDFNRNGLYEPTGIVPIRATGRGPALGSAYMVGDPEWIGVLERPDRPHSESNRFVGRYAFLVQPAGKSLDFNFAHNNAKLLSQNLTADGYNRNLGFGSWELNLAAFLRDLNTNSWRDYTYRNGALFSSSGSSFDDARALLAHRYIFSDSGQTFQLASMEGLFGRPLASAFSLAGLDANGDGPLLLSNTRFPLRPNDRIDRPWAGSDNPQGYYDVQELFHPEATSSAFFVNRLTNLASNPLASTYDRYTFYRLLAQIGMDSRPAVSNKLYQADFREYWTNKLHLNYRNDAPNGQTNFFPRDPTLPGNNPIDFFLKAADRQLRANLATNAFTNIGSVRLTHFTIGGAIPVRNTLSVTNIQIWHARTNGLPYYATNNEYNATVHRLLQIAANVYDATTTRRLNSTRPADDYPSVFRPTFYKTSTNIFINGFVEETGTNFLRFPWLSIEEVAAISPVGRALTNLNIFGIPFVIGAKKGYPNFNEFTADTVVQVGRKLEVIKRGIGVFQTNQMHVIGVSNVFGVEAWNSYTQNLQRPLELYVTNRFSISLWHGVSNAVTLLAVRNGAVANNMALTTWTNRNSPMSFILPVRTNLIFLTNAAYFAQRVPHLTDARATNNFESSFDPPQWFLTVTNRVQYIVVDRSANRVIDFVNLDNLIVDMDISSRLIGDTLSGGGGIFSDASVRESVLWNTNRASRSAPTLGVLTQIGAALGDPAIGQDLWRSENSDPVAGGDKPKAIQKFREFFMAGNSNLVMQVPFTPTRKIFQRSSWQANDPLVHYTAEDLTDPVLTASTNSFAIISPPNNPLPQSNLGLQNERYRPWGGNPNKTADEYAYRMGLKDPGVRSSDDWEFPTNKFPNIGWLGRVHRGTPWQTIYLKSEVEEPARWLAWAGSLGTHPTNDWKLLDLFTVAPNDNAARGLLAVNQTNVAAWSAVLSGVNVLSNSLVNPGAMVGVRFDDRVIEPSSPQLLKIVEGLIRTKSRQPNRTFRSIGDVLATPELTVASPFLNLTPQQVQRGLTDVAVERIPQQILSLLKTDEPRVVVYAFGQSLKPAERSLVTLAPKFFNICTNYQVTGELAAKAVLRVEDAPDKPRVVVESFTILPPE